MSTQDIPHPIEDHRSDTRVKCTGEPPGPTNPMRRKVLLALTGLGIGTATWRRALADRVVENGTISVEMIQQAEWIAGIELSDEQRKKTADGLEKALRGFESLREVDLGYDVSPAFPFVADPHGTSLPEVQRNVARPISAAKAARPQSDDELAFLPVHRLAALIQSRQVTSTELTRLYLDRLKRYDRILNCVVTLTEDLAQRQAERADREITAGRYRGPLHGIPWGAKDLIAVPVYPTTWGATPFKDQVIDEMATVARRLEEAGAVLVAKLALGALAQGDRWFKKKTRNPWNPDQGSSGSSAGSASATAAGLVGFTLGSETLGSIVSPCRRCGATGLRPTFGRVSRHGCMSLAWSMDKIGPITRSVEDCALVLDAIHGTDGLDPTVTNRPFTWPPNRDLRQLRVGYFETDQSDTQAEEIGVLRQLGVKLVAIRLPDKLPVGAVAMMLDVEAATVFDELTRQGVTEDLNNWPQTFREAQFVPAVEYLRASRVRTLLMREMREFMQQVDLYVGGSDLAITNLTGNPTVVLPNGFQRKDDREVPTALTFTGSLFGETDLLAVAHAYQRATGHHLRHPPLETLLSAAKVSNKTSENSE